MPGGCAVALAGGGGGTGGVSSSMPGAGPVGEGSGGGSSEGGGPEGGGIIYEGLRNLPSKVNNTVCNYIGGQYTPKIRGSTSDTEYSYCSNPRLHFGILGMGSVLSISHCNK
jgi:hypothetical protein